MGFAKQDKKQKIKVIGRMTPLNEDEMNEAIVAEKARLEAEANTHNSLWGPGTSFPTQADYQRACLGSKFNQ